MKLGRHEGFTIVELVVALTVIAVGVFGAMQVFLGSLKTTPFAESRTRATALAGREVERMRAAPYAV
jgi:type IV pilus assembly protein PilV